MKKILSFLIAVAMLFCLAACNSDGSVAANGSNDGPCVSVFADKKAVAPGDELVLYVNVAGAENLACFDIFITTESEIEFVEGNNLMGPEGFIIECNEQKVNGVDGILVAGMHMYAYTVENNDIASVTFKVPEDMGTGKSVKFKVECHSFDVSDDESGNDIYSVADTVAVKGLSVKTAKESAFAETRVTAETTAEETTASEATTAPEESTVVEESSAEELSEEVSEEYSEEEISDEESSAEETEAAAE